MQIYKGVLHSLLLSVSAIAQSQPQEQDALAIEMLQETLHMDGDVEWGGIIYQSPEGGLRATWPTTSGDERQWNPDNVPGLEVHNGLWSYPDGRVLAYYHSHPIYTPARQCYCVVHVGVFCSSPDRFSDADIFVANDAGIDAYVAGNSGVYRWRPGDPAPPRSVPGMTDQLGTRIHVYDPPRAPYEADLMDSTETGFTLRECPDGISVIDDFPWNAFAIARMHGDPHVQTFDGRNYSFQAAGEFVAVRSRTDDLEVQVRQEPSLGSDAVSNNTAVTARVHGSSVGLYAARDELRIMIDGKKVDIPDGIIALPHGGALGRSGVAYSITWLDGSRINATFMTLGFLNFDMALHEDRQNEVEGLFGNYDGEADNDLMDRGGASHPLPADGTAEYRTIVYGTFGESWRISAHESLLEYEGGLTNESYVDRDFPSEVLTVSAVPAEEREAAIRACVATDVRDPRMFGDCVLDVAATGEPAFADSAQATEALTAKTLGDLLTKRLSARRISGHVREGERANEHEFEAIEGQSYFFRVIDFDPALDLEQWQLISPNGEVLFRRCLGCTDPGGHKIAESGTYKLVVGETPQRKTGFFAVIVTVMPQPDNFQLGEMSGTITTERGAGSGYLEKPGAQDVYFFSVDQPSSLEVEVLDFDSALDLGQWIVVSANGDQVKRRCLGCGRKTDIELTGAGEYALQVGDSSTTETGRYTLRLQLQ